MKIVYVYYAKLFQKALLNKPRLYEVNPLIFVIYIPAKTITVRLRTKDKCPGT